MSRNKKMIAAALAFAAVTFAAVPATSALADGASAGVQCFGANACKGQGSCKSGSNSCKGQNSCKGKGFIMEPTAQDCTDAGGSTS
jgi:uncharacterized membrane protein